MTRRFATFLLVLLLTSCAVPGARSQVVSRTSLPLEPVGTYSLRGNPNFSPGQLSSEMQVWHTRLWEGIEYANNSEERLNPETRASSGDLYSMGRFLNVHITTLLSALRVTKDLALLDEVDRLMEMARAELADTNADGYQNWRFLAESSGSSELYGDDFHEMDEILAHSMVAAVAYALSENASFDRRYEEHAQFWLDYLKNDFEAKWRKRNDVPFGLPFISKNLMHPYVQFIRYNLYMYKLTDDTTYYSEANRMADLVLRQVRDVYTADGPAYVWNQRFLPEAETSETLSCQPFVYLQYTFQAFQDLAMEGFSVFDNAFMQRVATSMTALVIEDSYRSFAEDICGGTFQAGFFPSSGDGGVPYHFLNFPYAQIGKWDATGKLLRTTERAYGEGDLDSFRYPLARANLSATMLFLLADNPDGRQSSR